MEITRKKNTKFSRFKSSNFIVKNGTPKAKNASIKLIICLRIYTIGENPLTNKISELAEYIITIPNKDKSKYGIRML